MNFAHGAASPKAPSTLSYPRGGRPAAAVQLEQRLRVGAGTVGVQGTRGVGDGAGWALRLRLLGAE